MDKTYVSFVISDFGDDPNAISQKLGMTATRSWVAGEPVPDRAPAVRRHSCWMLESPLSKDHAVEEHLSALLSILEQRSVPVAEAALNYTAELQCAIYYLDHTPGIHLSPEIIRRVAGLGLAIDLDLYFLGDVDEAPQDSD